MILDPFWYLLAVKNQIHILFELLTLKYVTNNRLLIIGKQIVNLNLIKNK